MGLPLVVWQAADAGYAVRIDHRLRQWEQDVERDPSGVRIGCEAFRRGEGATAVLMIHGFGDSPALYREMAERMAAQGFACSAIRLPGFAEPMAAYRRTSLEDWSGAVKAEAQALRQSHRSLWLVGHSTGAALAIRLVLEDPAAADGLILLAPLFGVSNARSPVLSARSWFRIGDRLAHWTTVLENQFPLETHDPAAAAYPYRDRFVPMNVFRDLFRLVDDVAGRAGELTVPVYMALADTDVIIDTAAAADFFEELGSPRRYLTRLDRSGHPIPIDTDGPRVAREAAAFIRVGEETL